MNIELWNLLWHETFPSGPKNVEAVASSCLSVAMALLTETFKIVNRKYDINPELFFQLDEVERRGQDC